MNLSVWLCASLMLLSCKAAVPWDPCACSLNPNCMLPINEDPLISASLDALWNTFLQVDHNYNTYGALNATFLMSLGFFDQDSAGVIMGPPLPDSSTHNVGPGSVIRFGNFELSESLATLGMAFAVDPTFPHDSLASAPKIYHDFPRATHYGGYNQFYVTTSEFLHFQGDDQPTTRLSPMVAKLRGIALYQLKCDCNGKPQVPSVVWADYNVYYID